VIASRLEGNRSASEEDVWLVADIKEEV